MIFLTLAGREGKSVSEGRLAFPWQSAEHKGTFRKKTRVPRKDQVGRNSAATKEE